MKPRSWLRMRALRPRLVAHPRACFSTQESVLSESSVSPTTTAHPGQQHDSGNWEESGQFSPLVNLDGKTISTPAGPLPLSPLMDPDFHAARTKYTKAKAEESKSKDKSQWRRALERNPYALALATPIRQTVAPRFIALPRAFLQDFSIRFHPTTQEPWLVPVSLEQPRPAPSPDEPKDISAQPWGKTAYWLARQDMIQTMTAKKAKLPYQLWIGRLPNNQDPHVRSDMATFVLDLMRRRAYESLHHHASQFGSNRNLIMCESYADAGRRPRVGFLLWLGPAEPDSSDGASPGAQEVREPVAPPPLVSSMPHAGSKLQKRFVVLNLPELLGDERVQGLRSDHKILRQASLFWLSGKKTLETQQKLWKLQGYMVRPAIA